MTKHKYPNLIAKSIPLACLLALVTTLVAPTSISAEEQALAPARADDAKHVGHEHTKQKPNIRAIIASRDASQRARDKARHPRKTLKFFGIRDNMTVVELWPGGGWYSRILAPYLNDHGQLYAAHFNAKSNQPSAAYARKRLKEYAQWMDSEPNASNTRVTVLSKGHYDIAPEGSADAVLTFRNVHNWMKYDFFEDVVKASYRVLKPGGVFGVVEHRAPHGRKLKAQLKSGYVSEQYVIDLVQKAGFKLADRSEINANPKDTASHPDGVWSLPPTLRTTRKKASDGDDKEHKKYIAIGESDRFTLKFIKPKRP